MKVIMHELTNLQWSELNGFNQSASSEDYLNLAFLKYT